MSGNENAYKELQIAFEPSAAMPSGYSSIKDLPLASSKFTYNVGVSSTHILATEASSVPSNTTIADSFQYLIRVGESHRVGIFIHLQELECYQASESKFVTYTAT